MSHKLEKGSVTVSLDIRVPMTLKKKIQAEAEKVGLTMSEYIRHTMHKQVD